MDSFIWFKLLCTTSPKSVPSQTTFTLFPPRKLDYAYFPTHPLCFKENKTNIETETETENKLFCFDIKYMIQINVLKNVFVVHSVLKCDGLCSWRVSDVTVSSQTHYLQRNNHTWRLSNQFWLTTLQWMSNTNVKRKIFRLS